MSFDDFHDSILRETNKLIDDIKSGRDVNLGGLSFFSNDPFFSSSFADFNTRRRNRETANRDFASKFSSFPSFTNYSRTSSEVENDPDKKYHSTRVKRSESTYSTSSYDTNDSNDTLSEMSDSSFSPGSTSSQTRPKTTDYYNHTRNSSSDSSTTKADLTKKLEEEFLKDERHSMPHEIYSKCNRYLNDLDRPKSMPPGQANSNISSNWKDSNPDVKCFPSKTINSRDLHSYPSNNSHFSNGYCSSDSGSKRTVTGSVNDSTGSGLNSLCSYDFPSMDGVSNFEGDLRSPSSPTSQTYVKTPIVSKNPTLSRSEPNVPTFNVTKEDQKTWKERQGKIEDALKWLRTELGDLRTQDKDLINQLSKCQDTIEAIKKQRTQFDETEEFDEEEEDHWEDWEIAEYDRRCKENKNYDGDENANKVSKTPKSPTTETPTGVNKINNNCGVTSDVEAVL